MFFKNTEKTNRWKVGEVCIISSINFSATLPTNRSIVAELLWVKAFSFLCKIYKGYILLFPLGRTLVWKIAILCL